MGHEILHRDYPENVDKKKVEASLNNYVAQATWQEGGHGLNSSIRWIDHICDNYDDAIKYIESHDKGWYDQLAVKYRDCSSIAKPKSIDALREKMCTAVQKARELERKPHFAGVKSAYLGCKYCGSKISSKFLNGNYCPVCRKDMRPDSTLAAIEKAVANAEKAKDALNKAEKDFEKKMASKVKVRWLVKIEYHM